MPNHIRAPKSNSVALEFNSKPDYVKTAKMLTGMISALILSVAVSLFLVSRLPYFSTISDQHNQNLAELETKNRQLQDEVDRLKKAVLNPSDPKTLKMKALVERIHTIEQHQIALVDALKGPQLSKGKLSSLDMIEKSQYDEEVKLGQLGNHLDKIEANHIALAKSLTDRSEKSAQMLTLMLSSVSDLLVNQSIYGKEPARSQRNIGGPLIQSRLDTANGNSEFPKTLTAAISTMQQHASLYKTLVNLPLARPVAGEAQFVSGFGNRSDPFTRQPAFHAGIDLKQDTGSAVLSTGNGIVIHAGPADGYGNMVEIAHAGGVTTRYGHLSRVTVAVGEAIFTGQRIGLLGNSGRSTGPHLHYETRIRDQAVNPVPFLQMGERLR